MSLQLPISPLQKIPEHPGVARGITLFIKRDDLLHPEIQGSKGRKLAAIFPLVQASYPGGVLTFGGAFSNHLHAVAVGSRLFRLPSIGILRGMHADLNNPTLLACANHGMRLLPWPKARYDACKQSGFENLQTEFPDCYILPEGGNIPQALKACAAISEEIIAQLPPDSATQPLYLCAPAGTGCTAAGIIAGLKRPNSQVLIFPVSHQGLDRETILRLLADSGLDETELGTKFLMLDDYLFGGFAKLHPSVMDFTRKFWQQTKILPDPIYTAKMLYGIYDLLAKDAFPENSTVVAVHTGGMQGWDGFQARFGKAGEPPP